MDVGHATAAGFDEAALRRAIDLDLELAEEAIALVATRRSRRVIVGGLHFGDELLPAVGEAARRAHVAIRTEWSPADPGSHLMVEGDG